jgi:hypothetical protein
MDEMDGLQGYLSVTRPSYAHIFFLVHQVRGGTVIVRIELCTSRVPDFELVYWRGPGDMSSCAMLIVRAVYVP